MTTYEWGKGQKHQSDGDIKVATKKMDNCKKQLTKTYKRRYFPSKIVLDIILVVFFMFMVGFFVNTIFVVGNVEALFKEVFGASSGLVKFIFWFTLGMSIFWFFSRYILRGRSYYE